MTAQMCISHTTTYTCTHSTPSTLTLHPGATRPCPEPQLTVTISARGCGNPENAACRENTTAAERETFAEDRLKRVSKAHGLARKRLKRCEWELKRAEGVLRRAVLEGMRVEGEADGWRREEVVEIRLEDEEGQRGS